MVWKKVEDIWTFFNHISFRPSPHRAELRHSTCSRESKASILNLVKYIKVLDARLHGTTNSTFKGWQCPLGTPDLKNVDPQDLEKYFLHLHTRHMSLHAKRIDEFFHQNTWTSYPLHVHYRNNRRSSVTALKKSEVSYNSEEARSEFLNTPEQGFVLCFHAQAVYCLLDDDMLPIRKLLRAVNCRCSKRFRVRTLHLLPSRIPYILRVGTFGINIHNSFNF